jgi:Tol biopolymer transport system component
MRRSQPRARLCCLIVALLGACSSPGEQSPPPGTSPRIIFVGGVADGLSPDRLFLVHADGTGLQQLTDGPGSVFSPFWSNDGGRIYFGLQFEYDGQGVLPPLQYWVLNADGTNLQPLPGFPAGEGQGWSPDGTHKAFAAYYPSAADSVSQRDLYVRNADSSEVLRLVNLPTDLCNEAFFDCADIQSATWSPTGEWIAYSTYQTGRALAVYSDLAVVSPDGSQQRTLIETTGSLGAWSPDGQRLAFAYGLRDGVPQPGDLALIDLAGAIQVVLDGHSDGTVYFSPAWSPSGASLVFSRCPVGQGDQCAIYIANADGTGLRRVAAAAGGASDPSFNPKD